MAGLLAQLPLNLPDQVLTLLIHGILRFKEGAALGVALVVALGFDGLEIPTLDAMRCGVQAGSRVSFWRGCRSGQARLPHLDAEATAFGVLGYRPRVPRLPHSGG